MKPLNSCSAQSLPTTVGEGKTVPVNFGDIVYYNQQIAARYYLRAQIERDCGKNSEADYHTQLAARYSEAANEQQIAMSQAPGSHIEDRKPRPWTMAPRHVSLAGTSWIAIQSHSRQIATAIRQFVSRRNTPLHGLSLD